MSIFELELLLEALQRKQKELQQTMNQLSKEIEKLILILQQLPKAEQSQQWPQYAKRVAERCAFA